MVVVLPCIERRLWCALHFCLPKKKKIYRESYNLYGIRGIKHVQKITTLGSTGSHHPVVDCFPIRGQKAYYTTCLVSSALHFVLFRMRQRELHVLPGMFVYHRRRNRRFTDFNPDLTEAPG